MICFSVTSHSLPEAPLPYWWQGFLGPRRSLSWPLPASCVPPAMPGSSAPHCSFSPAHPASISATCSAGELPLGPLPWRPSCCS